MTGLSIAEALFVDAGPTRSAYAHVEAMADGLPRVVGAWYVQHDRGWLWDRLDALRASASHLPPELWGFTVETIKGEIYQGRSAAQILETKEIEGRIKEASEVRGIVPSETTAHEWRKTLVGNGSASNAQIRAAVRSIFGDALKNFGHQADEHILDAIGGGLIVLAKMLLTTASPLAPGVKAALAQKLRISGGILPPAALMAVQRVVLEERQARSDKKVRKAMGLDPKRAPRRRTRQQELQATAAREITIGKKGRGRGSR